MPIEAIGHHILERQEAFPCDGLQHGGGSLRFALKGALLGDLACRLASSIRVGQELMVVPLPLLLIPGHLTDEPLQSPDGAALDSERYRLNGLPFELAALAHHLTLLCGRNCQALL